MKHIINVYSACIVFSFRISRITNDGSQEYAFILRFVYCCLRTGFACDNNHCFYGVEYTTEKNPPHTEHPTFLIIILFLNHQFLKRKTLQVHATRKQSLGYFSQHQNNCTISSSYTFLSLHQWNYYRILHVLHFNLVHSIINTKT